MQYRRRLLEIFNEEKRKLGLNGNIELSLNAPSVKTDFKGMKITAYFDGYPIESDLTSEKAYADPAKFYFSFATKREDNGSYLIHIGPHGDEKGFRKSAKHELYHIYKGDCDRMEKNIFEIFWIETRARLYENYSLRL